MDWDAAISIIFSAVVGIWGFCGAWAFRHGGLRRMARWYFMPDQPNYVRNLPFILLPMGFVGIAATLIVALGNVPEVWADVVVGLSSLIVIAGLVAALVFASRPPEFLKPAWLKDRENQR